MCDCLFCKLCGLYLSVMSGVSIVMVKRNSPKGTVKYIVLYCKQINIIDFILKCK